MKSLKEEGITKEFLSTIDMNNSFSPVQLLPDEEPVKLIKCSTGYWVMLEFGDYLKDEKNKLVVIPDKEAKIGRARYLLNFKEEIKKAEEDKIERLIQKEIINLKKKVDDRIQADINKMEEILFLAEKITVEGFKGAIYNLLKNQPDYQMKKQAALELADDQLLETFNRLKNERYDYNIYYQYYFQDGLPLIASFKLGETNRAFDFFKKENIEETIENIGNADHLYNVAKFNVLKQFK